MRLFVSYPSDYRGVVEPVVLSLRNSGHTVFFDQHDLPPGQGYDQRIETAIRSSTSMIFFIAPQSFVPGSYQLSELEVAQNRWPSAHRRVLPVSLTPTDFEDVPSYIKSVTILEPKGNLGAEVSHAVAGLSRREWRRPAALLGIVATAGLAVAVALFMPRPSTLPTELTEKTVDSVIDQLVPEADKVHVKEIVRAQNKRPFLFIVYEAGRDIVFTAIKWRDGQWRIVRTVRDEMSDFSVSTWKVDVEQGSRSIVFSGCRAHMCPDVWGYLYYQFDLEQAWTLKASSNGAAPTIAAPLGFPERQSDLYNFERRFYSAKVADLEPSAAIDAAIMAFPRRRAIPPMWERSHETTGTEPVLNEMFRRVLRQPADTQIELIYREDLDGDGQVEWLVQTASGNRSLTRLHTVRGSRAAQIFEDPGDIDSAWTRFALHPVPGQAPYLAVGGRAGSGAFPFWYVLQANGDAGFKRLPVPEKIENLLNDAFNGVFQSVQR